MALVTTVAGAAADSYITVAEADAFATVKVPDSETRAWLDPGRTTEQLEASLRDAAQMVDDILPITARWVVTQALRWPRLEDYTVVSGVRTPYVLPDLKRAVAAQARFILANAELFAAVRSRLARGPASFSEQGVSGSERGDTQPDLISGLARLILTGYVGVGSGKGMSSVSAGVSPAGYWP